MKLIFLNTASDDYSLLTISLLLLFFLSNTFMSNSKNDHKMKPGFLPWPSLLWAHFTRTPWCSPWVIEVMLAAAGNHTWSPSGFIQKRYISYPYWEAASNVVPKVPASWYSSLPLECGLVNVDHVACFKQTIWQKWWDFTSYITRDYDFHLAALSGSPCMLALMKQARRAHMSRN
jgi:hypothetical protein